MALGFDGDGEAHGLSCITLSSQLVSGHKHVDPLGCPTMPEIRSMLVLLEILVTT